MLDALTTEVQAQISPQAMFALAGGLMGACLISAKKVKHDGLAATFIFIFFGMAMALVGSDIMLINLGYDRLGAHAALGAGCGTVGGAMMPAIRAISPSFAEKLVDIAAKAAIGFAQSKDRMKRAIIAFFEK